MPIKTPNLITLLYCKRGENAIFGVWDHPAAIAAPLPKEGNNSPPLEGQGWLIQNYNLPPFSVYVRFRNLQNKVMRFDEYWEDFLLRLFC